MADEEGDVSMNHSEFVDTQTIHAIQGVTEEELDAKYPNRPRNHGKTLPFHELFTSLFNPLRDNRKRPVGQARTAPMRRKVGPDGPVHMTPNEMRQAIIERFISRWRKEVGNDIFPALRLILPEKDRERAMYGLKELTIGKLIVKIVKIDPDSEDAFNLKNWKSAGARTTSTAGDFAGRCYDVLSRRPLRTTPGDMTIGEVDEMLEQLALAHKEDQQLHIFQEFYQRMNAEELSWLIRIVLRQMKIGATEKTILGVWHPDAETLFNVSSNLRRVCWELYDPGIRLQGDDRDVTVMQCFQPQLAQFQMYSFDKMVQKMRPTEADRVFWVEEKLDGERMQLHMVEDGSEPGGRRFGFWSRKAKDYTYLYGKNFEDQNSALTRHLQDAFDKGVRNIVLDGEMITWNMKEDKMVDFGTLKTAAIEQQKDPFSMGNRPVYRVFDILVLNDVSLTKYNMRERRGALEAAVHSVHRRLEIHQYVEATAASEIEPLLRDIIETRSEGLVVKNPRSAYHLNERNDDWIKVKPEYMTEYGEAFDCIVVGGYYGSGRRGGGLSSFLCGLPVRDRNPDSGELPQKCISFFKVGGGFSATDYIKMRHMTEGKWHKWDTKKPPRDWVVLGGGDRQHERPDEWIKPEDSVVLAVKAASLAASPLFAMNVTLRFPRFKSFRTDKDWKSALSVEEFLALRATVEKEQEEKQFEMDSARRLKRSKRVPKKELTVANEAIEFAAGQSTGVFGGMLFCVMSGTVKPDGKTADKSKAYIEQLAKLHGAQLTQASAGAAVCFADREPVGVRALKKTNTKSILRPAWILDCVAQAETDMALGRAPLLLPYEPRHVYFVADGDEDLIAAGVDAVTGKLGAADAYGDSYAKDCSVDELRALLAGMPAKYEQPIITGLNVEPEGIFRGFAVCFDAGPGAELETRLAKNIVSFARGLVIDSIDDTRVTTVVLPGNGRARAAELRRRFSGRRKLPRIVTAAWVFESWKNGTVLDEERESAQSVTDAGFAV